MKTLVKYVFATAAMAVSGWAAAGQAIITGPSALVSGQAATVTWTVQQASTCQSGVRVVLNLSNTSIQTGNLVQLSAGKSVIPGVTLAAGSKAALSLMDTCSGSIISAAHAVTVTGGAVAATPAPAAPAVAITPQVTQNIDSACQGVLGLPCSTTPSYNATYSAITQQITQGRLGSDLSSVMYSYLIPMVGANVSWKTTVVDNAWRGSGCQGIAPEAQWVPKYGQWQTYQQLVNLIRQAGCASSSANTTPAVSATQYLNTQQMSPAYNQVWGSAAGYAAMMTNCPVSTGAVSCARSALAAYVRSNGTAILQALAGPVFQSAIGSTLDSTHAQTIIKAFGVNWSGADDLLTWLRTNASQFQTAIVLSGLNSQGCLVDSTGKMLAANEPCGMYYISSGGVHTAGTYAISLNGRTLSPAAQTGGGLLVNNMGIPVRLVGPSGGTWQIVAGSQIVAAGGGNIVAAGGGNIVAAGGGNIVAAGGGNVVNTNGSNMQILSAASAAQSTGLSGIISQDGNGLLASVANLAAVASAMGSSNSLAASAANSSQFVGNNGSAVSIGNTYQLTSVPSAPMVVITGPSSWASTQAVAVTWTANPGAPSCATGFRVLLNGDTPTGNAVALSVGKSVVPGVSWPKGSRFSVALTNLCTGAVVSAPFTTTIQ